jgi:hypothetical protein
LNAGAKILVNSLATSFADHTELIDTFPIKPIFAKWALFAPLGIGMFVTFFEGNRHTTSFVNFLPGFA